MAYNIGVMNAAVSLDTSEFNRELNAMPPTAEEAFKRVASLAATYLSARGLYSGIKSSINAFAEQEKAVARLQAALKRSGQEIEFNTKALSAFAAEMQKNTVHGDEKILDIMATGLNKGIDLSQIEDATRAALEISAAYKIDLASAMDAVAKAAQGNFTMINRLGVELSKTASDEEKFAAILKIGKNDMEAAKAEANSLAGTIQQTANAVGDAMEKVGQELSGNAILGLNSIRNLADSFNNLTESQRGFVYQGAALIGGLLATQLEFVRKINDGIRGTFSRVAEGLGELFGKGQMHAQKEAAAVAAAEEVKRQEYRKTRAEKQLDETQFALAQTNAALKDNPEDPELRGKQLKLEKELAAQKKIVKAETEACTAAEAAAVLAEKEAAMSATTAGRAKLFLAGAAKTAKNAIKGLIASVGPLGWLMIAIQGLKMAYDYFSGASLRAAEAQKAASDAALKDATNNRKAIEQNNKAMEANIQRLQRLAAQEILTNAERKKAAELIATVNKTAGREIALIDEKPGKLKLQKKALAELIAKQKEEAREAKLNEQRAKVSATQADLAVAASKAKAAINGGAWTLRGAKNNALLADTLRFAQQFERNEIDKETLSLWKNQINNTEEAQKYSAETVEMANAVIAAALAKKQEVISLNSLINGVDAEEIAEKEKKESELADYRWKTEYDDADNERKAAMLAARLEAKRAILDASAAGKDENEYSADELRQLREILELEKQRNDLRKEGAKYFATEAQAYADYLEQQAQSQRQKAVDRALNQLQKSGNTFGAEALINQQYQAAARGAEMLRNNYLAAVEKAKADGIVTEEEQKGLQRAREKMEQAEAEALSWSDRIQQFRDAEESDQRSLSQNGSFSTEVLNALLGGQDPEREVAQNTREMTRILRRIEQSDGGSVFM